MPSNNGEIHYFTKLEMELIAEAVYEHYFDDHTEGLEEEEFGKEIIALGKKVGAIGEGDFD